MIDNTCAILSMNVQFDIKQQEKILCKIPSDSNARISYSIANFLMQYLGMPSERFLAWRRKHSPTFSRQVLNICIPSVPWRSTWKLVCCFLIVTNARQILTMVCKVLDVPFEWGIYRYVLTTKFLIWSTNAIEIVLVFSETRFKAENLFTGVTGDTGVNMCLHHARNRIAVQNNAQISTIIFTLKQVYWFCQLSAMEHCKCLAANVISIKTVNNNLVIDLSDHMTTVMIWTLSHNARNS